ncbi:MAG: nucleotidyltransferase domain-containing protein [Candidatus Aenigmatarchaeota archaeon]
MIEKYYKSLEENKKFFENALEIAKEIKERVKKFFKDYKIYIGGSFARNEHKLNSDLDIIIVSPEIPEKMKFDEYFKIISELCEDERVNIHLLNKDFFERNKRIYKRLIEV